MTGLFLLFFLKKYKYVNNVNEKLQSKSLKNKDSYRMWFKNVELLTS